MRHTRRLQAFAGFAIAALAATSLSAPAVAQTQDWGIVSIKAANLRVNTGSCEYGPFTVTYQNVPGNEHSWSGDVQVWRGPTYVDERYVFNSPDSASNAATLTASDEYFWCSLDGWGTYRLGPTRVDVSDYTLGTDATFTDDTTTTFTVKQDATVSLSAGRVTPRRMVKLSSVSRYFNYSRSRWVRWADKTVVFQRSTSTGWETIAKDKTNSDGVATVTVSWGRAGSFRAVTAGATRIWNAKSKTVSVPAA